MAKEVVSKREHRKRRAEAPLLAETRRRLKRLGLRARKGLGQHFLVDDAVLEGIVAAAELESSDVVVEIGPGLGVLTRELASRAGRVVAVELDDGLAAVLMKDLASLGNVTIVNEDILKTEPASLLGGQTAYKVVANLPYYITSAVLRHFLTASHKPQLMVVTIQKEVAEAIVARSGTMSLLSNSVRFYGEPSLVSYVPASSFYPVPSVDSAVVRIALYPEAAVAVSDEDGFFGLLKAAFTTRRKQLVNSLANGLGLPRAEVLSLLKMAAILPQRRAESLTLKEWARLWHQFEQARKPPC